MLGVEVADRYSDDPGTAFAAEVLDADASEVVIALSGEVDIATAPQMWEALVANLRPGLRRVALNCSSLLFLDASGLRVLMRLHEQLQQAGGGEIVLVSPPPTARRALQVCGMEGIIRVVD